MSRSDDRVGLVVPLPVVEWRTVVQADSPGRQATVGRLRELRKKNLVGAGVTVAHREGRRLRGRSTYYSVLAALAVRSRADGHDPDAAFLTDAASALESRFAEALREFLARRPLRDLPEAPFFPDLAAATAERLADWSRLPEDVLAAAVVSEVEGGRAHLEGTSARGEPVTVDLPRALLDRDELTTGDLVWVSARLLGSAALVEVLPAVELRLDVAGLEAGSPLRLLSAPAGGRPPAGSPGSDGLEADERAAMAASYRATAAASLDPEDLASLRQDASAGRLPRRSLRPAG
jgi:hypothetical protein